MRYLWICLGIWALAGLAASALADPLDEVPREHRAYAALQTFQDRGLVRGLPQGVLKGTRPLTRYEMAVLVSAVVKEVKARMKKAMEQPSKKEAEAELATPSGLTAEDLTMIRSLQAEFSKDLDSPAKQKEEATALKDLEKIVKQHTIKGYLQVRYQNDQSSQRAESANDLWGSDAAKNNQIKDTFLIRRARLQLGGKVSDKASYQIDWELAGPVRSNEPNQDRSFTNVRTQNAYLQWGEVAKGVDVQVGQFKNPLSYEVPTSDAKLEFPERSFALTRLLSIYDRGVKILGKRDAWGYQAALVNGNGENRWDDNRHKDIAGRVTYSWPAVTAGVSLYRGKAFNDKNNDIARNRTGLDLEWNWNRGGFRTEYIRGKDGTITRKGWYAMARQQVAPAWDIVSRYQELDPDTAIGGAAAKAARSEKQTG
ncbi:MAG: hypothetical protein IT210_12515, partial [Armatimonadetes bacterium]|nr:hypothetical protein [Armatimonadota bacterium]